MSLTSVIRRGRYHMAAEIITTHAISPITNNFVRSNPAHGEVYSIQHYVTKSVRDFRQVSGFLLILPFPPPIKLTATI